LLATHGEIRIGLSVLIFKAAIMLFWMNLAPCFMGGDHLDVDVIIAQPPCTHFALSGARWWEGKGEEAILEGLQVVDACFRIAFICKPRVFMLEQPVGRLIRWIGQPRMRAHPWEFAGYADDPSSEGYTKKTCIFGEFNIPDKKPWEGIIDRKKIHYASPGKSRRNIRSAAPQGMWRALHQSNKG